MAENKTRVAIIGAGTVARDNQIPAFLKCSEAEVAAVFDRHLDRAQALCERYGIAKAYDKLENLLADQDIDSVSVCTGNVSHESLVISAAEAGKNILCEKPMAISVAEAENMTAAVEKSGVTLWECRNCGHMVLGTKAPEICPVCKHPQAFFEVRAENY